MKLLGKISPAFPLRLGLGAMYLYSGYDIIRNPNAWTWAIPQWFSDFVTVFMPIETYLHIQGGIELALAVIFLAWFLPRKIVLIAAFVSTVEIIGILLLAPFSQFLITFRDLGVLGASASLLLMTIRKHGKRTAKQT